MKRFFSSIIDRIFCLVLALGMSQVPRFIELYETRLSGHVAEAQKIVSKYTQAAELFNMNISQYISKLSSVSDPMVHVQAKIMEDSVVRMNALELGYHKLLYATWYEKPFAFLRYLDLEVAQATIKNFTFGLSFTIQTLVWMALGLLIAVMISSAISSLFKRRAVKPLVEKS